MDLFDRHKLPHPAWLVGGTPAPMRGAPADGPGSQPQEEPAHAA